MTGLTAAVVVIALLLLVFVTTMLLLGVAIAFGTRDIGDEEPEPLTPVAPHRPMWR